MAAAGAGDWAKRGDAPPVSEQSQALVNASQIHTASRSSGRLPDIASGRVKRIDVKSFQEDVHQCAEEDFPKNRIKPGATTWRLT